MTTSMRTIIAIAAMAGVSSAAMADKTWNSDPSTYDTEASSEWVDPTATQPVQADPDDAVPADKDYKLYKAPKAQEKSSKKSND